MNRQQFKTSIFAIKNQRSSSKKIKRRFDKEKDDSIKNDIGGWSSYTHQRSGSGREGRNRGGMGLAACMRRKRLVRCVRSTECRLKSLINVDCCINMGRGWCTTTFWSIINPFLRRGSNLTIGFTIYPPSPASDISKKENETEIRFKIRGGNASIPFPVRINNAFKAEKTNKAS